MSINQVLRGIDALKAKFQVFTFLANRCAHCSFERLTTKVFLWGYNFCHMHHFSALNAHFCQFCKFWNLPRADYQNIFTGFSESIDQGKLWWPTCHPPGFFSLQARAILSPWQALGFALVPCMWRRDFSPLACDVGLVELPQVHYEATDVLKLNWHLL